ncbi:uncharacterized protein [Henckelia pumila]|uniref:uncharacterized protein n=1 Tax=Henckelia pumila TaxID=405737 RepID=UPI003C6E0069
MAALLMWSIWQNRNDVVWNGKSKPAAFIFSSAMNIHSQWLVAHNSTVQHSPHLNQQQIIPWKTPPPPFVKCNVDATLFHNPPRMGYGCIIRDHRRTVLGAIHGIIPGIQNHSLAEDWEYERI